MAGKTDCLACGGSGYRADGTKCDCPVVDDIIMPYTLEIPSQYQGVRFDKSLLPDHAGVGYGEMMDNLLKDISSRVSIERNILICSPPNTGKTVFSYTVYGVLYAKGVKVPKILDLVEVRDAMFALYNKDVELVELLSKAQVVVIKIPMDLPNKFPETISTIIERRVRNSGTTIFLCSASKEDLIAQDKFGKLKYLIGDGSYNSIDIRSYGFYDKEVHEGKG